MWLFDHSPFPTPTAQNLPQTFNLSNQRLPAPTSPSTLNQFAAGSISHGMSQHSCSALTLLVCTLECSLRLMADPTSITIPSSALAFSFFTFSSQHLRTIDALIFTHL